MKKLPEGIPFSNKKKEESLVDLTTQVSNVNDQLVEVSSQLAQKAAKADTDKLYNVLKYSKYGNITLPNDFSHNINFNIYRDIDGKMKHDFNVDNLLSRGAWKTATFIYVSQTGASGNDGLTAGTPIKSLKSALDMAEAGGGTHYIIKIVSKTLDKDNSNVTGTYTITKNIAIVSDTECFVGNLNRSTGWAYNGDGLCTLARSSVRSVYDTKFKTVAGLPRQYENVTSLDECKAKYGSWFYDGSLLYINRLDGSQADSDELLPSLGTTAFVPLNISLGADVQFIMKNISLMHYMEAQSTLGISSTGTTKGHVILWNTKAIESGANGIATNGVRYTWVFNGVAYKTKRDGLNYHNTITGEHFVLEFDCAAFECGVNDTNQNNNCSTAHEEARILRVNSKGWISRGPVLADVNGCYSILYDCNFTESLRTAHSTEKVAYQFANITYGSEGKGLNGKAIMINCEGGGVDTGLLATGGGFAPIQVLNLKGDFSKIVNTTLEYIA